MDNYKDCYVAFLDILGFRDMIEKSTFDQILDRYKIITNMEEFKVAFSKAVDADDDTEDAQRMHAYNEAIQNVQTYIMSDSIVLAVEKGRKMVLEALIDACIYIQNMLYEFEPPVLLRGAIAEGEFYCKDSVAFGKGMVKAYSYEENYSIYPRIILAQEIVLKLQDKSYEKDRLHGDEDSYYHVDCLREYLGGKKEEDAECVKFQKMIKKFLDGYYDASLKEKYRWLQEEYDRVVKNITYHKIGFTNL